MLTSFFFLPLYALLIGTATICWISKLITLNWVQNRLYQPLGIKHANILLEAPLIISLALVTPQAGGLKRIASQ